MGYEPRWIRFDVDAWFRSPRVRALPAEARGYYVLMLLEQAASGQSIPAELKPVANLLGLHPDNLSVYWKELLGLFTLDGDGGMFSPRMKEELENAQNRRKTAIKNGRKGGRPKGVTTKKPVAKQRGNRALSKTKPEAKLLEKSRVDKSIAIGTGTKRTSTKERERAPSGGSGKSRGMSSEQRETLQRFLDWWCSTWSKLHDGDEFKLSRKDRFAASRLVRAHERAEIAKRAQRLLEHPFAGLRGGASPETLERHWNRLGSEAREGAGAKRGPTDANGTPKDWRDVQANREALFERPAAETAWEAAGEERALIDRILAHEVDLPGDERTELLKGVVPDYLREKWS